MSFGRAEAGSATRIDGAQWRRRWGRGVAPSRLRVRGLVAVLATVLIALPVGARADSLPDSAEVLLPVAPPPGIPVDDDPVYTIAIDSEPRDDASVDPFIDPEATLAPDTAATTAMSATIEDLVNRDLNATPPEGWSGPALVPASTSAVLGQLQQPILVPESLADEPMTTSAEPATVSADVVPAPQEVAAPPAPESAEPAGTTVAAEPTVVTGKRQQQQATEATAAVPNANPTQKSNKPAKPAVRSALGAKKKAAPPAAVPSATPFDNARARN